MRRLSFVAGIVVLTAVACTDPTSQLPTTPSSPTVDSVELTGPASIAPGQSVQLIAVIRLSDGTVKSASSATPMRWASTNNSVLSVNSTGLATGGQMGEARIFATYGTGSSTRQASKDFVVVPDGTYRLVGIVRDAEAPGFALSGVRVEATPGSAVATTDSAGQYRLYGVPANAVIHVSRNGYAPLSQAVQLTGHTTRDFQLVLSGTRVMVGGTYTLEIDATVCSGGGNLSADLRRRVYEVAVTQNGPSVEVLLTEPRFRLNSINRGNRFIGYADGAGITFVLESYLWYYYPYYGPTGYPNVAERLPSGTFLVPEGRATVSVSAAGVSGTMGALISNFDSRFPASNTALLGYCSSPAARFTMTPR